MKGQQAAACTGITRLIALQRQLFVCVGVFGCVCVAYKYRLCRQKNDLSFGASWLYAHLRNGAPYMGSHTLTVCLIVDSPTFHYLLQPGSAGLKYKKGIFLFIKKELNLYQAVSLIHMTKTKTVFIVVFADLPTLILTLLEDKLNTYNFCNKVHTIKGRIKETSIQ